MTRENHQNMTRENHQKLLDVCAFFLIFAGIFLMIAYDIFASTLVWWTTVLQWLCFFVCLAGVTFHKPRFSSGWSLLTVVVFLSAFADTLLIIAGEIRDLTYLPTTIIYLIGYLLALYATVRQMQTWSARQHLATVLDGLTLAAAILTAFIGVTWASVANSPVSVEERWTLVSYFVLDTILIVPNARLLFSPGGQVGALRIASIAIYFKLVEHMTLAFQMGHPELVHPRWNITWYFTYPLLALAITRASSVRLREDGSSEHAAFTPWQIGLLTISMCVLPMVIVYSVLSGWPVPWPPLFVGGILMAAMVSGRVYFLVRVLRERTVSIENLARSDGLTGVANRRRWDGLLADRIDQAFSEPPIMDDMYSTTRNAHFWVAMLDLDYFKKFNDTFGHQAGDTLLRESARSWKHALGDDAEIARYGGEEFAVLLHVTSEQQAIELMEAARLSVPGGCTCSIGLVAWGPGISPDEIMRAADTALYVAKDRGRNRLCVGNIRMPTSERKSLHNAHTMS